MSSPVEQIKARLSIVDVVGSYIRLEKAGGGYRALCPFHNEKSPSFNVSPTRNSFHCFGCNRGGDIFSFVQEIEGGDFTDALRVLAERAGVPLTQERPEARGEKTRLHELLETATTYFEKQIGMNKEVMSYLYHRGLTDDTLRKFRIGYAPLEWRMGLQALTKKGFREDEQVRAGVAVKSEKGYYDRFRGRIMFPISDPSGKVIAFSGRVFGTQGDEVAKYINSPETPLFDKSTALFGYDKARASIRTQNFSVVVEGQMDLVMSHQGGIENTVASSGTALTEKHLALLKRLSDNVVFAFDADEAGLSATRRAYTLALHAGMNVRVAVIPEGKDPADAVREDPAEWVTAISESLHVVDFFLRSLDKRHLPENQHRKEIIERVFPLIASIPNKVEQEHWVSQVARRHLGLAEDAVREDIRALSIAEATIAPYRAQTQAEIAPIASQVNYRVRLEEELLALLSWRESVEIPGLDTVDVYTRYVAMYQIHGLTPMTLDTASKNRLAFVAENKYTEDEHLEQTIEETLDNLEKEVLREQQSILLRKMATAKNNNDKEEEGRLFERYYRQIVPRLREIEDRAFLRRPAI